MTNTSNYTEENIKSLEKITKPPGRYTEASLVKDLEKKGIGRPSTFSNIVDTLFKRNYIKKESRTGYSIGIGYPPDWGEHTLNIYKGDMTVLKPNVCFHMIAVMQFGNWGVEASEAIRVTEKGSELFCNLSKELHVKS